MMMNKRLIGTVCESKKYIAANVILQWCSLLANIAMMMSISRLLASVYLNTVDSTMLWQTGLVMIVALLVRYICATLASRMAYLSSKTVKKTLRERIYQKLLKLGASYSEQVQTSEAVQVAVEGVEQLETYFGSYLPQFFYAMLAPLTLFIVLSFINFVSAFALFICVPLIPIAIAGVQTFAKKLLAKYWGQYVALGDTFLENLQGLTTLKIYQADGYQNEKMNQEAEEFRKITMKVLTMQLNSITIMDLVAYGGAALGIILAITQYAGGHVPLFGCLLIILLSADFFLPMRLLGSFFHIAMNGMAASDKIFRLLDLPENPTQEAQVPQDCSIQCSNLHFSYTPDREILHGIDLSFTQGSFTAIVGESGCGKSTIAGILTGQNRNYSGSVTIGGLELAKIQEESLMRNVTYIGRNSYLFKGTVRDNLLMAKPQATEDELWGVLKQVNLEQFLKSEQGLDTLLLEKASNFSGGQCQRLALARALLHDSPIYIFDEATSNIDVESEDDIMAQIYAIAKTKTVILISHRLVNVVQADNIYVIDHGDIVEQGTHQKLLETQGHYKKLWDAQQSLEQFGKDGQDQ